MLSTQNTVYGYTNISFFQSDYFNLIKFTELLTDDFLVRTSDEILSSTKGNPFWIDLVHEPFGGYTEKWLVQELTNRGFTNFLILTGNINFLYDPADKILYQPQSYLESRFSTELVPRPTEESVKNNIRQFAISCLNGRARVHRIENFLLLRDKPYFNQLKFSMHNNLNIVQERSEPPGLDSIDPTLLEQWHKVSPSLPAGYPNDWSTKDSAYTDSYINFVTETCVNDSYWFLSEKIWKPIIAGQLFIVLAYPHTIQHLRELGIDVFDDIIDHSYDKEPDWHKRIYMLHAEIDRLMSIDLAKIFTEVTHRRMKNYNLFYSSELFKTCTLHLPPNSVNVDIRKVDFTQIS